MRKWNEGRVYWEVLITEEPGQHAGIRRYRFFFTAKKARGLSEHLTNKKIDHKLTRINMRSTKVWGNGKCVYFKSHTIRARRRFWKRHGIDPNADY